MADAKELAVWLAKLVDAVRAAGATPDVVCGVEAIAEYAAVTIRLESLCPGSKIGAKRVRGLSLTTRRDDETQTLAVLRTVAKTTRYVTFCSGRTGVEALLRLLARVDNGDVRWQEDRPREAAEAEEPVPELPPLPKLTGDAGPL